MTSIGAGVDTVASIALQADARILVAGRTTSPTGDNDLMLVRYNVDGSLDTSFGGGDGIAVPGLNTDTDEALSVKTQADGKIVVSGYSAVAPLEHAILVARFNVDGSLDTSFAGDGTVTTDIGPGTGFPSGTTVIPGVIFEAGHSLAIQPDGRILVVGYGPTAAGGTDIALVRYDTNGSLDASFGAGGIVTTAVSAGTVVDRGFGVALQADGRIVVAGAVVTAAGGGDFAVLRYDSNGSLDTTFGGGDGIVTVAIGPGAAVDQVNGVAIQTDGRIVVTGSTLFGTGGNDAATVRLNSDGSLDTSFGGIGAPVVNSGQPFSWSVQRFFADADNDNLTYTMSMADGSPLPAGFTFGPVGRDSRWRASRRPERAISRCGSRRRTPRGPRPRSTSCSASMTRSPARRRRHVRIQQRLRLGHGHGIHGGRRIGRRPRLVGPDESRLDQLHRHRGAHGAGRRKRADRSRQRQLDHARRRDGVEPHGRRLRLVMTDKAAAQRGPADEIRGVLARCRQSLVAVAVFSCGINVLFLVPAIYMLQVYDRVLTSGSRATLLMLTLIVLFLLGSLGALEWVRTQIMVRVSQRIDALLG